MAQVNGLAMALPFLYRFPYIIEGLFRSNA